MFGLVGASEALGGSPELFGLSVSVEIAACWQRQLTALIMMMRNVRALLF